MTPTIRKRWISPTDELYAGLEHAYRFFNEELFGGELPGCLFTLQRKRNTYGYYGPSRFLRRDARGKSDEIALNPAFFAFRTVDKTLSTLAHEMAHQWQAHFGRPSRSGYHNKEWADKMESIGLMPSNTGAPGGKRLGQQMTHYIAEGGLFEQACRELMAREILISWIDVQALTDPAPPPPAGDPEGDPAPAAAVDIDVEALAALGLAVAGLGDDSKRKTKYSCSGCNLNVWGKAGLKLACEACRESLTCAPSGPTTQPEGTHA